MSVVSFRSTPNVSVWTNVRSQHYAWMLAWCCVGLLLSGTLPQSDAVVVRIPARSMRRPLSPVNFVDWEETFRVAKGEQVPELNMPSLLQLSELSAGHRLSSPCEDCTKLISSVTSLALRLNLNTNDVVLKTQFLGRNLGVCDALDLRCNVYSDVRAWLAKGGLIGQTQAELDAALLKIKKDPQLTFCKAVNVCGKLNLADLIIPKSYNARGSPVDGVIVRLKLKDNLSSMSHTSNQWKLFVQGFVADVAQYLTINVTRVSVHQKDGDSLTDVVIRSNAELNDQNKTVGEPPEKLAHRLKSVFIPGSGVKAPPRLVDAVNPKVKLQIIPLVIPSNVDPLPPVKPSKKAKLNQTQIDCNTLRNASQTACGNTFKCSKGCQASFHKYYSACLQSSMSRRQFAEVGRSYHKFFYMCEHCTEVRRKNVYTACGLNKTTDNMPTKCPVHCSVEFTPFYNECLLHQLDAMSTKRQQAVKDFMAECSKCSTARQTAVHKICDPRLGVQKLYYPSACTQNCSEVFIGWYGQCLKGSVAGIPPGSEIFNRHCEVARDGGVFFRIVLTKDIVSVVHEGPFRAAIIAELAQVMRVPKTRLVVTGIVGKGGKKIVKPPPPKPKGQSVLVPAANSGPSVEFTVPSMTVDVQLKSSPSALDADPGFLVDRLRRAVMDPLSALYSMKILKAVASGEGVKLLVPNSHTEASERGPSSLDLAVAEQAKAKENGAGTDILALLRAIVEYHTALSRGGRSTLVFSKLAEVNYQASMAHDKPKLVQQLMKARLEYAVDMDTKTSDKKREADLAYAEYLGSVVRQDSQPVLNRDWAIVVWKRAIEKKSRKEKIAYLFTVVQQLVNVAARAPKEIVNYDNARAQYMKDVMDDKGQKTLKYDEANVEYFKRLRFHVNEAMINAAAAYVRYRKAIMERRRAIVIEERKAVLDFLRAKENKEAESVLRQLSQVVVRLHRRMMAEKLADKDEKKDIDNVKAENKEDKKRIENLNNATKTNSTNAKSTGKAKMF